MVFEEKRRERTRIRGSQGSSVPGVRLVLVNAEVEGSLRDGVGDVDTADHSGAGKAVTGGDGNTQATWGAGQGQGLVDN